MPRPSVTVVLSVRNGAEFLARSIESVLAQDGVELELLVYDNGSSDGSDAIAEGYLADPRVRLTRNPPGLRFPDSMNLGLERASGDFFVPWACDDEMLPRNLARKAEMLAAADAGLAFGGWLLDRGDGELRGVVLPAMGDEPRLLPAPSLFPLIATANAIAMPTVLIRTAALREVGGFDTRPELTCDWLLWLRLALRVWRRLAARAVGALPRARRQRLVPRLGRRHLRDGACGHHQPGARRRALPARVGRPPRADPDRRRRRAGGRPRPARAPDAGRQPVPCARRAGRRARALPPERDPARPLPPAVADAGLAPPALPGLAVAAPAWTRKSVADAVGNLRALADGGLVDGCCVAVSPADLDTAVVLLESELERGPEVGLDLVVCDQPLEPLRPGCVFVAPWGDELAVLAESMGVPALTFGMPTPYDD